MTTTDIKMILTEEMETTTYPDNFTENFDDLETTSENHYHLNELIHESSYGTFIGYGILIGLVIFSAIFGVYKGCKKLRRDMEYNRLQ